MKKYLFSIVATLLCITASAQSALDADFEDGTLPSGWTVSVPASPYKGGFSVVNPSTWSKNQKAGIGTNDLYGKYVMMSKTGGTNGVKGNSDNWFISPEVTISDAHHIFSFILGANCSYSPIWPDNQMKMDIVVIDGDTKTVVGTIAPENYFTWKQYAYDLSAYMDKSIKVAFHDYGTAAVSVVTDMKFIDNIKLSNEILSDYSVEEVTPIHGQALYTQPYTIKITNYGVSTGSFTANYSDGSTIVSETVNNSVASGNSIDYTFQQNPTFTPGKNVTFKVWASGTGDAMNANDTVSTDLAVCPVLTLPYSVINEIDSLKDIYGNDSVVIANDVIGDEFGTVKTKVTKSTQASGTDRIEWTYDAAKYHAWIFQQGDSTEANRGICYLYTTKAFRLPKGKVTLTTTGTGTGTDMHFEVYIAKYWDKNLTDSPVLVGISDTIPDAYTVALSTTKAELTIPEAGTYTIGIRPLTANIAQMTVIGFSLSTEEQTHIYGDVNNDGNVDISDVNAIISVICGGDPNPLADVNNDGTVDISDVNAVISVICGGTGE